MSETQTAVSFWYGTRAQYALITKDTGTIYFIADENAIYKGEEPFTNTIKKLLCFADSAPSTAAVGDEYYNTTDKKIYTCTTAGTENSPAVWGSTGVSPQMSMIYYDKSNAQLSAWNGTAMVNMCDSGSALAAASSAAAAANSAVAAASSAAAAEASASSGTVNIDAHNTSATAHDNKFASYYTKEEVDNILETTIGDINAALDILNGDEIFDDINNALDNLNGEEI